VKAQKLPGVAKPLRMSSADRVRKATGVEPGSIGPIGFAARSMSTIAAAHLADFVCGANEKEHALPRRQLGARPQRAANRRSPQAQRGDPSPTGHGTLEIARGIEVGHIFQLGHCNSAAMNASVLE